MLTLLINMKDRVAAVPGNCDRKGARLLLAEMGISADGRLVEAGTALIAGSGGSAIRTGITPYERQDHELGESIDIALSGLGKRAAPEAPIIALSHAPPFGSGADLRHGANTGSRSLEEALKKLKPVLWCCGHIHESRCVKMLGTTLIVNPGPLSEGNYAVVRILRANGSPWIAEGELKSVILA